MGDVVSTAIASARTVLASVSSSAWGSVDSAGTQQAYRDLCRVEAQVAAMKLIAVRRLETLGAARAAGATSTGALLATVTDGDRRAHERLVRTAQGLAQAGAGATEDALADAQLSLRQVEVITDALNGLPGGITPQQRKGAERTLMDEAGRLQLPQLRRRGERLVDEFTAAHGDGDADATEDQRLRRRELAARAKSKFLMWDNHDGTHAGKFTVPDVEAAALRAALQAMTAPRRQHLSDHAGAQSDSGGLSPGQPPGQGAAAVMEPSLSRAPASTATFSTAPGSAHRNGAAFADLLLRLPTDGLPQHGGTGALITVNIDLEALTGAVARAGTIVGTDVKMSAAAVRHEACRVGVLPMVFNGEPLPLDLGREQRLFNRAQRRALAHRDRGCAFPGCDRPPSWTEVHHITPWARGGKTSIKHGVLLCSRHHHLIDEIGYQVRVGADGYVEFRHPAQSEWRVHERFRGPPARAIQSPLVC
ncbi:HNH endonuclease signature motif containing protein [Branchiibius sp. NY16-3462-2]|uniref:HNH endonuclease signature motif containing protein n=1 Tax=Branchiibius sp. NY16-3462-2 TaxID=1807500 RepID=UPI0007974DE1|nr:HNH endonuclease signature motif containing protein [Branchiibius sp. NY16-3462-2]KYH43986.1 hypothetical protein AZH51_04365 [Branchiibius sp. NY16-3462-2]